MTDTSPPPPTSKDAERTRFAAWLRQPETLIGLSAVLLSVCGLGIALYEASIMRAAQRSSVWPHLEVASSMQPGSMSLWVQNTGVGPARVGAASVTLGGEPVVNWGDLLRRFSSAEDAEYYQSLINGRVLPTGSEREVIFQIEAEADSVVEKLARDLSEAVMDGRLELRVCYCSVYDECWESSLQRAFGRFRGEETGEVARKISGCDDVTSSRI